MHVLQEVWDVLQIEDDYLSSNKEVASRSDQLFLSSSAALSSKEAPRTMKLSGCIQQKEVSILVDSRSSHTFASAQLASSLGGLTELLHPVLYKLPMGKSYNAHLSY